MDKNKCALSLEEKQMILIDALDVPEVTDAFNGYAPSHIARNQNQNKLFFLFKNKLVPI